MAAEVERRGGGSILTFSSPRAEKALQEFARSPRIQEGLKGALVGALFGLAVAGVDYCVKFLPSSVTPIRLTALSTTLFALGFALRRPKVDIDLIHSRLIERLEIGESSDPEKRALLLARVALHPNQAYLLVLPDLPTQELWDDVASFVSRQAKIEDETARVSEATLGDLMGGLGFSIKESQVIEEELLSLRVVASLLNLASLASFGAEVVAEWAQNEVRENCFYQMEQAIKSCYPDPSTFSIVNEEGYSIQGEVAQLLSHFTFSEPAKWEAIKAETQRQIAALGPKAQALANQRFACALSTE